MTVSQKQLVKKMSLKTIIGKVDVKTLHETGAAVDLFTVGGRVTGTKKGLSTFGEWVAFTGNIGAVRHSDGVEFRGAELFVPEVAEGYMLPVVDAAAGAPVDFAFIIGVKPMTKPSGELSYEYTVKPIVEAGAVDPLDDLMGKMKAATPSLAAPEVKPDTEQEKAQEQTTEQTTETAAAQETSEQGESHNKRSRK